MNPNLELELILLSIEEEHRSGFESTLNQIEGILQQVGGEMLLKAVAAALISVGDASNGPVVGRVINTLADVEW